MHNFFALANRLKYIQRWGLMRSALPENTAEHSLAVAMIAHNIALVDSTFCGGDTDPDRVAVLAMFHDTSEAILGDLPSPIKYHNEAIYKAYKELEQSAERRLLDYLPPELRPFYAPILSPDRSSREYQIIKAADILSAYIKCLEELASGNNEFIAAKTQLQQKIDSFTLPSIRYFVDNFLEAYGLTIDEMAPPLRGGA